jgi:hypothetical protein
MFKEIKYFIQRAKRGYSDRDLWDLGSYISKLMINAIGDYSKNLNTYPVRLNDGEWANILKDMKAGFQAIIDMGDLVWVNTKDFDKEYKRLKKIKDKGLNLFIKHIESLWD